MTLRKMRMMMTVTRSNRTCRTTGERVENESRAPCSSLERCGFGFSPPMTTDDSAHRVWLVHVRFEPDPGNRWHCTRSNTCFKMSTPDGAVMCNKMANRCIMSMWYPFVICNDEMMNQCTAQSCGNSLGSNLISHERSGGTTAALTYPPNGLTHSTFPNRTAIFNAVGSSGPWISTARKRSDSDSNFECPNRPKQ